MTDVTKSKIMKKGFKRRIISLGPNKTKIVAILFPLLNLLHVV